MTYTVDTCHSACTTPQSRPSLLSFVTSRLALMRQRRSLKTLDDRALEDIGISRADAQCEANRSIWDAPANWKA